LAAAAEAAGAQAFVSGEFASHDAYVTLTQMALSTTTARIGTGVAYAFTRSPYAHATALRQIDRLAPGRVFLGLGSGTPRMNTDWFAAPADRPLARMADLIGAIKAYLGAPPTGPVRHAGEFYPIDATFGAPVLGPIDVPVVIGAFNQGMLRTAARVADGIIGHGLFTDRWWDETVDPNLGPGKLCQGWVITAIDDADPARAERDARLMIGFYLTVKTYDTLIALHGWEVPVAAIRDAFRARDFDAMAAAVTVDMLDSIAVYGTSAEARDRLAARRRLPNLRFHSPPSFLVSDRRKAAYTEASIDLLSGRPAT